MFLLLALLLLLPLGHTQKTTSTPTKVSVLEHIFPPYRGPASYFASVVAIEDQITTLAMTCLQPTSWPTPDPLSRDPCDTSSLGIRSQTITQGNGTWGVEHGTTLGEEYWTRCQRMSGSLGPSATENPFDASSLYCSARYSASGFPPLTEEGFGRVRFGLSTQLVTVTAGFDVLGEPLETASSRTDAFTDIGKTPTQAAPVTTVTLHYKNQGRRTESTKTGQYTIIAAVVLWFMTI